MSGAIVHDQNGVHTLTLKSLTTDLDSADSSDPDKKLGPAIYLRDPGGTTPVPDDWSSSNRNGQSGVDGTPGSSISATVSLDSGFGIKGPSGVVIESSGWSGSRGHEAKHTDKHATGGRGGAGAVGGDVTFSAKGANGGKAPSAIQVTGTTADSRGIQVMTTGGAGGAGGWAESKGGLRDAEGGVGGTGGAGGNAVVNLLDGHFLAYQGGGVGIQVVSQGGDGGGGNYAEVDGWDADNAYGGVGGAGGNGGSVSVDAVSAKSTVVTTGPVGILLSSIGGNGGDGGDGKGGHDYAGDGGDAGNGGDVTAKLSVDVTMTGGTSGYGIYLKSAGGQAGDSGGDHGGIKNHAGNPGEPGEAGDVDLTLSNSAVTTEGAEADGILLQSIGGMGGNGGDVSGVFSYGSKGGSGGAGGAVTAAITSSRVSTTGDHASALHVQSVGGGGGKAGKTSGLSALASEAGAGGTGGTVTVTLSDSTFDTQGLNAAAIKVQSIGGGGGSSGSADGFYSVGGSGGLGGLAGTADLLLDNVTVTTEGTNSVGILVESIGAGGGDAHSPSGAFAIGQDGGGGGNGNTVTFTSQNGGYSVATGGKHSDGVLLQSVGGGGGKGASSFEAVALLQPLIGTSGGGGGSGGDVTFTGTDADSIKTSGAHSRGFLAQSIGGGGGVGGNTVEINVGLVFNPQTGAQSSSSNHHGGTVSGSVGGTIATSGDNSAGVFVQSVGGGGGSSGNSVQVGAAIEFNHDMGADGGMGGDGGTVNLVSSADITTSGDASDGIIAQSVGGGGGQSGNVLDSNVGGLNLSQYVGNQGASGGAGGNAGTVSVVSSGKITTTGHLSSGIFAQSVAGGGGMAGTTINADASISAGAVTLGQSGGAGGKSDQVKVSNKGEIHTSGTSATGIFAQSVAGGGGQANTTVHGNLTLDLSFTHGGDGGAGGEAGDVIVDNDGTIRTDNDGAIAIFAQSLGGGGGNGALTASGAVGIVAVNIAVGGNGGDGGTGGAVTVGNTGALVTQGNYSIGIAAQSQGGSGGNAGMLAQGTGTGGPISGSISVGVGGSGGAGGVADKVEITNSGTIQSAGYGASGIAAQSVGGDGGMGGAVYSGTVDISTEGAGSVNVTVGGAGGGGGTGGEVSVDNSGAVTTTGHYADAIFAQSVGGNGGAGGLSYGGTLSAGTGSSIQSNVEVGGKGGSGAVAGNVHVANTSTLATTGGNSHGIFAQSVGGNGGDGGAGYAFIGDFAREKEEYLKVTANAQVGGFGGSGNHAGKVTISNSGDISTSQDTSYGVFAQSVGGGGGDGGNAGAYTIGYTLKPETEADEEAEAKGVSLSYTMGGNGGGGGHGDTVSVTHETGHTIKTEGVASYAIFAQSVGGSGGVGGNGEPGLEGWLADVYDIYEKINTAREIYEQFKEFPKSLLEGFSVDVGGGGDGGSISVTNSGSVKTSGEGAMGIFAQSVGGGGGAAGDIETTIVRELDNLWETVGSLVVKADDGGEGGDGGDISIVSSGSIVTTGDTAHGIFATSVGGGGGAEGELEVENEDDDPGYIGSEGRDGLGGRVEVTIEKGTVDVSGQGAIGIFAQSASGAGTSYSEGVAVTVNGTVRAQGAQGRAIMAQASTAYENDPTGADADQGVANIVIGQNALVETTSEDAYETIAVMGGRTVLASDGSQIVRSNSITNQGTLRSASLDAVVVRNDQAASLVIVNDGGSFSGSLDLDDNNAHVFQNTGNGVVELGTAFDMGSHESSAFENLAVITAGKKGEVHTSTITTGAFSSQNEITVDAIQSSGGAITNDLIVVDVHGKDGKIDLGGQVSGNWVGAVDFTNGTTGSLRFLQSANAETIDWSDATASGNGAISYTLRSGSNDSELFLDYEVDYTGASSGVSFSPNALKFATYFNNAMEAINAANLNDPTSQSLQELSSHLLNSGSAAELERRYREHSADASLNNAVKAAAASQALHSLLQSCPVLDPNAGDDFFRQRECVWTQAIGNRHFQSATVTNGAFREDTTGLAGAIQKEVLDDTFVEVGGQIEYLNVRGTGYSQSGTRFSAGVALKHETGPLTFSTTIGGGFFDLDQTRNYTLGAATHSAAADIRGGFLTVEGRISAVFQRHGFYAKPALALSATQLWQDAFNETGSGPLNWSVDGVEHTSVAVSPVLELGHAFDLAKRPTVVFLRAGLTAQLTDTSIATTAALAGGDSSLGSLTSVSGSDRVQARFAVGLDMDVNDRFSVSVLGQAGASENTSDFGGYARAKFRF
ncbi:hypothetical protein [Stappia sp.]|uniref:hypothetical protein n=1 Tax=Stappia sp. TaxID=1870903 RepID=UPI003A9A0D78